MYDVSKKANDSVALFTGSLVVGNHDSITLFGIHAQNSLKEYSRKVSALFLKDTVDLDKAIADVISEIDKFESKVNSSSISIFGKSRKRKEIIKEYNKILSYIESVTLYFKLQQAQLIKEIKFLEKLAETVQACSKELENCIETGKSILRERRTGKEAISAGLFSLNGDSDEEIWYSRLDKRIDDLSVSHTVSLQSYAQIHMLRNSDLIMLDKIAGAISNTLPIWQNQMAVLLGIDLIEKRLDAQKRVVNIAERHIEKTSGRIKSSSFVWKSEPLAIEDILEINKMLKNALSEMKSIETNDGIIRQDFRNAIHQI